MHSVVAEVARQLILALSVLGGNGGLIGLVECEDCLGDWDRLRIDDAPGEVIGHRPGIVTQRVEPLDVLRFAQLLEGLEDRGLARLVRPDEDRLAVLHLEGPGIADAAVVPDARGLQSHGRPRRCGPRAGQETSDARTLAAPPSPPWASRANPRRRTRPGRPSCFHGTILFTFRALAAASFVIPVPVPVGTRPASRPRLEGGR